ncbi:hypothetical protein Tco_0397972 [Tanacetum coccineum]
MTTTTAEQVALDNAFVPLEKRVEIGKCNMRINPKNTQKESTYQVVLDALALTTCYPALLITADVPEIYMHQIDALPSDEEIVYFIKELRHKGDIKSVTDVVGNQMYQPWRTFASIINKCLSGKITEQTYQEAEEMYYPRFTKAIIHHFITKNTSISMRNRMFMNTVEDDSILGPVRFVSKADDYQVYGALLPEAMTNQKMRDSPAYKTYLAFATGAASPTKARKFKKPASPSRKRTLVIVEEEPKPTKKVAPSKKTYRKYGLGDGAGFQPKVLDEPKGKSIDTHEGTGDDEDVQDSDDDPQPADDERTDSENQETIDDDEESHNEFVHTPEDYVPTNDETKDVDEEEYDRIDKELYRDVNVRLTDAEQDDESEEDADMIDVAHV